MKVVVSTDAILNRDYYLECIETILDQVGDECELYTLIHKEGSVLGHVEMRKIHSSFLSNIGRSWEDLLKNSYLIPGACKNLFIPCSVDLIINVSRGFSHGIRKCKDTKQITLLFEDVNTLERKRSFKEKVFSLFIKGFQLKSQRQADEIWTSDRNFISSSYDGLVKDVLPPVKLSDYKILPSGLVSGDYFLVNAESVSPDTAKEILDFYKEKNILFKFIGIDIHLSHLKEGNEKYFFGDKCSGELAPLLSSAKYLIDFERNKLPIVSLKMMSCGGHVFSPGNRYFEFGIGFHKLDNYLSDDFLDIPDPLADKKKIRGRAIVFDEVRFKHFLKKELLRLEGGQAPYNVSDDNCC